MASDNEEEGVYLPSDASQINIGDMAQQIVKSAISHLSKYSVVTTQPDTYLNETIISNLASEIGDPVRGSMFNVTPVFKDFPPTFENVSFLYDAASNPKLQKMAKKTALKYSAGKLFENKQVNHYINRLATFLSDAYRKIIMYWTPKLLNANHDMETLDTIIEQMLINVSEVETLIIKETNKAFPARVNKSNAKTAAAIILNCVYMAFVDKDSYLNNLLPFFISFFISLTISFKTNNSRQETEKCWVYFLLGFSEEECEVLEKHLEDKAELKIFKETIKEIFEYVKEKNINEKSDYLQEDGESPDYKKLASVLSCMIKKKARFKIKKLLEKLLSLYKKGLFSDANTGGDRKLDGIRKLCDKKE